MSKEYIDFRGVCDLVAAEVIQDDAAGYACGEVFDVAGVATLTRSTDSSSETKYYDNIPAIVIMSNAADTVTIDTSVIPPEIIAKLTGQKYDNALGCLIEGQRETKYFAFGYKTQDTSNNERFVWRYKCSCNVPDDQHNTINAGTDSNGQQLVLTGIETTHKFAKNADSNGHARGAKALVVNTALGLADVSEFFETVVTPDTLEPAQDAPTVYYTVTYNANGGTGTIDSVAVEAGSSIGLNDGATLTPPTDKEFAGWAKSSAATNPTVTSPFTPDGDVTLYAVYTDVVEG